MVYEIVAFEHFWSACVLIHSCVFSCRRVCNVVLYMDCHFAQQPLPPMCNQIGSRSTVIFHRLMNRNINVNWLIGCYSLLFCHHYFRTRTCLSLVKNVSEMREEWDTKTNSFWWPLASMRGCVATDIFLCYNHKMSLLFCQIFKELIDVQAAGHSRDKFFNIVLVQVLIL